MNAAPKNSSSLSSSDDLSSLSLSPSNAPLFCYLPPLGVHSIRLKPLKAINNLTSSIVCFKLNDDDNVGDDENNSSSSSDNNVQPTKRTPCSQQSACATLVSTLHIRFSGLNYQHVTDFANIHSFKPAEHEPRPFLVCKNLQSTKFEPIRYMFIQMMHR